MTETFYALFTMSVVGWLAPRLWWTYRYPDVVSILLMAICAAIFAGASGYFVLWHFALSEITGPIEQYFAENNDLVGGAFKKILYGLALSVPISILSGILYAKRLNNGGRRFFDKILHDLGWAIGYFASRIRHYLGKLSERRL